MECLFEFYDGLTMKSNTILNSGNMPNEAFIIVTVLDAGSIAFASHCIHGVTPILVKKSRASLT